MDRWYRCGRSAGSGHWIGRATDQYLEDYGTWGVRIWVPLLRLYVILIVSRATLCIALDTKSHDPSSMEKLPSNGPFKSWVFVNRIRFAGRV